MLTGILGGLVSSTATTADLCRLQRRNPGDDDVIAAGILIASATMFPRMLVMVAAVDPSLLPALARPLLCAGAIAFAAGGWYALRSKKNVQDEHALAPGNPLDLGFALKFGPILALISVLARAANA